MWKFMSFTESCNMCNIIEKRFISSRNLKCDHLINPGKKKYACNICGKRFYQGPNLKIHQQRHTQEKKHTCEVCGKMFTHLTSLKRHHLNHTACNICGKRFYQLSYLKNHLQSHITEKKHCSFNLHCPTQTFTHSTSLDCCKMDGWDGLSRERIPLMSRHRPSQEYQDNNRQT